MMIGVLLIDLQNDFAKAFNESLIESVKSLVTISRSRQYSVFWIKSHYGSSSPDRNNNQEHDIMNGTHNGKRMCLPETPGADFYPPFNELQLPSDIMITKMWYNCFKETDLQNQLRERRISHLLIAGVTGNNCVQAAALAALAAGFHVYLIPDCIRSFSPKREAMAYETMVEAGASVLSLRNLIDSTWHEENHKKKAVEKQPFTVVENAIPRNEFFLNMYEVLQELKWGKMTAAGNGGKEEVFAAVHGVRQDNDMLLPLYREYSFENVPRVSEMTPLLKNLHYCIERVTGQSFNHVTLLYQPAPTVTEDTINPGAGNLRGMNIWGPTLDLEPDSSIVYFSIGAPQQIYFLAKDEEMKDDELQSTVILRDNSLLVLSLELQHNSCPFLCTTHVTDPSSDSGVIDYHGNRMLFIFRNVTTFLTEDSTCIVGQHEAVGKFIQPIDNSLDLKQRLIEAFQSEYSSTAASFSFNDLYYNRMNGLFPALFVDDYPTPSISIPQSDNIWLNNDSSFKTKLTTLRYHDDNPFRVFKSLFYVNWSIPNMRVIFLLDELSISCHYYRCYVMTNENLLKHSQLFQQLNPYQLTPTFIDNGMVYTESLIIIEYLYERYGHLQEKLKYFYGNPNHLGEKERIKALASVSDDLRKYFKFLEKNNYHSVEDILANPQLCEELLSAEEKLYHHYDIIEKDLSYRWKQCNLSPPKGNYLFGNSSLTYADIVFYPVIAYQCHRGFHFPMERYPCLNQYLNNMKSKKLNPIHSFFVTLHVTERLDKIRKAWK
jgi:nicotinamidase-related amidase/glutathione S-transferase